MKNLKFSLLILMALTVSFTSHAQSDKFNEAVEKSSDIIKGKVISFSPYLNESGNYDVLYNILVQDKLKGADELEISDTVHMIAIMPEGWTVWADTTFIMRKGGHETSHIKGYKMLVGTQGVFIGSINDRALIPFCDYSDCFFRIGSKHEKNESTGIVELIKNKVTGFGMNFNSVSEFNTLLDNKGLKKITKYVSLNELAPGTYIINVGTNNNSKTVKIIKQ